MKRPFSWSMRFALALSAIFVVGTISAGGLSYLLLSRDIGNRLTTEMQSLAERLAAIADEDRLVAQIEAQSQLIRDGSTLYVFIDAQTGERTGSLAVNIPFEGAKRLVVGRDMTRAAQAAPEPPEAYLGYGVRTDLGWVLVARDEAWVVESGELLIQTTAVSLTLAALLSFALALIIAKKNEARIDRMDAVLKQVGAGLMDQRIRDKNTDDLAALANRVDRTLDQLELGVASIRQVSTDVAHDLRAPLARLRMRLEPQALSPELPEMTRHEIGSALMDIDAISGTFDAILRLAQLQSGTMERRNDPVDLNACAREIADVLEASVDEAGHSMQLDLTDGTVTVQGDANLLTQAVTNLVVNAIEHCPSPTKIIISTTTQAGRPAICVSDTGHGIPAEDRTRVLERFVRLDRSRSTAGTGLGLNLVAAIAQIHEARLTLEDNAPGLKATILFTGHSVWQPLK